MELGPSLGFFSLPNFVFFWVFYSRLDAVILIKLLLQHFCEQTQAKGLVFMEKYASKHV